MSSASPLRLAVLVSGGGRSLENLAERIAAGSLDAKIVLVLANTPASFALQRAARLGLEHVVVPHQAYASPPDFSAAIFSELAKRRVDLVVLAGFLRLLIVPEAWVGRVINIHPSLLPAFGGKGFYGEKVHQAVIDRGAQFTGCTVHFVTNEYDSGPIVLQRCIAVPPELDAHQLAERVFEQEKLALPEAIQLIASGKLRLEQGRIARG